MTQIRAPAQEGLLLPGPRTQEPLLGPRSFLGDCSVSTVAFRLSNDLLSLAWRPGLPGPEQQPALRLSSWRPGGEVSPSWPGPAPRGRWVFLAGGASGGSARRRGPAAAGGAGRPRPGQGKHCFRRQAGSAWQGPPPGEGCHPPYPKRSVLLQVGGREGLRKVAHPLRQPYLGRGGGSASGLCLDKQSPRDPHPLLTAETDSAGGNGIQLLLFRGSWSVTHSPPTSWLGYPDTS